MLNESKTINKYPSRDKFITNFASIDWLAKRVKEVNKQGKPERIALYKDISVDRLLIEEPTVIHRSKGYFRSTVLVRKNGLCVHDPKINLFTFPAFLTYVDPDKTFYNKPGAAKELTLQGLEAIANETSDFSYTNEYLLTKIASSDKYALVVTGRSLSIDLDEVFNKIFDGYEFQKIEGYVLEDIDDNYPVGKQTTIDGYAIGNIVLEDILLKEQKATIDIFNVRVIKDIIDAMPAYYDGDNHYAGKINYSGHTGQSKRI